jgi:hypothetical protein
MPGEPAAQPPVTTVGAPLLNSVAAYVVMKLDGTVWRYVYRPHA